MSINQTQNKIKQYFAEKVKMFGGTPKGTDYNSIEAQNIRFEQLVRVINPQQHFTVIDYGCGYGAMFDFLYHKGWGFEYYGMDNVEEMIKEGSTLHKSYANCHFTLDESQLQRSDYLIAGAIFNLKLDASYESWQEFAFQTLGRLNGLCTKGFSFNMLTKYSDSDRMAQRPDLFYGDPMIFFDHCKRNFSKNVALLHDYGLYDFTILVRKDV